MFSMLMFLFIDFRSETAYLIFLIILEIIMLRSAQLLGAILYTIIVMFIFAFNFIHKEHLY